MAAVNFPNSPAVNDEFVVENVIYRWNGTVWEVKQSTLSSSSFSNSNPIMNGSAAAGTSGLASRSDHVHPSDTSKASTTHASSHGSAGSDPITIAQSQVTNLTTDLSNKVDKTVVDAKGDLLVGSADNTVARQVVGSNGQILMADSSATTGLIYTDPAQGRTRLYNGDLNIWQRGTSVTESSSKYIAADRWYHDVGGSTTVSRQTSGVPVGSRYCMRVVINGAVANTFQSLETNDCRAFWGKVATFSVRLRRNATFAGNIAISISKNSTVDAGPIAAGWSTIQETVVSNANLPTGTGSSDWVLATVTATIPSDGTANSLRVAIAQSAGESAGSYYEVAQAQLEVGAIATPFEFEPYETTLRKCQRYFERIVEGSLVNLDVAQAYSTTQAVFALRYGVRKRSAPSITVSSAGHFEAYNAAASSSLAFSSLVFDYINATNARGLATVPSSFFIAGNASYILSISSSSTLDVSAEL